MYDQGFQRKPSDLTQIHLKEGWEVCYWTTQIDASEEELAQAIRHVGPAVDAVRGYFRNQYARSLPPDSRTAVMKPR